MATDADGLRRRWRRKCWQWARRYVPAEIAGTACAFAATAVVYGFLNDRVLAAVAGTIGEIIGFYALIATVEWRRQRALGGSVRRTTSTTARLLIAEFGLIELLDSTLLRPLFMYLGPLVTGGIGTGTLLGKLLADVVFYGVAIVSYELIRRRAAARTRTVTAPKPAVVAPKLSAARPVVVRPAARPSRA